MSLDPWQNPGKRRLAYRGLTCPAEVRLNNGVKSNFYLPQLDGLRFIAFLMVFSAHSLPHKYIAVRAGGFGVDLFFCLSAYLITTLLRRESDATGRIDIKSFYIRRLLRIWPLYFTFLFVGYASQFLFPSAPLSVSALAAFSTFLGNWWIVVAGYPAASFALLWSLCVEEQFYLVWPPLVKRLGDRLMIVAAAMITISVVARVAFALVAMPDYAVWTSTVTRLDGIAMGVLVAVGWRPLGSTAPGAAIAIGASCLLLGEWIDSLQPRYGPICGYLLAAYGSAMILYGVINAKISVPRLIIYLGKISFGLYVFHRAVIDGLNRLFPTEIAVQQIGRMCAGLVITIFIAHISYRWLEAPFLRIKTRFEKIATRPV